MSFSTFNQVKVSGIVCVVPENYINIDDEINFYGNDGKRLARNKKILGLGNRHVVSDGTTATDLCEHAAKILIDALKVNVQDIDTLIMTSINHDYNGNSDACIIQGHLGLSDECACFDTCGLGCTDAVYGLWLAHSLIQSGASRKCLFLEGALSSLITDKRNRHSNMLFGDAGAAVLLEKNVDEVKSYFHLKSMGRDWRKITTPAGGFRLPIRSDITDLEILDSEGNVLHLYDSVMRGGDIFKFAIENGPDTIAKVMNYAEMSDSEIDFYALHQANGQIVKTIANHAKIGTEKYSYESFSKYGNCGGTSVLLNYCDQSGKGISTVLMATFGVGLSVSSCILDVKSTWNGGVHFYKTPENVMSREEQIKRWTNYLKGNENSFDV